MNLICFPHYTCGGLLCDIFSDKLSSVDTNRGAISSLEHSIGKIGDSESVLEDFDTLSFLNKLDNLKLDSNSYVGTHCWPGNINTNRFNNVICVTTTTYRSRVYRWARCFYHYYQKSKPWELSGIELIDKQRETAKNYLIPFKNVPGAINLEFSDVVDVTAKFKNVVDGHAFASSLSRWKKINEFLYHPDFWTSKPVQRYHEAEYELNLNEYYAY
jgi:hypothetical protein